MGEGARPGGQGQGKGPTARGRRLVGTRSGDAHPLGEVIDELGAIRPVAAGLALGRLGRRWEEVVGARLAAESTPVSLEGGRLVVTVASSAWAAQVRFLARDVGAGANRVLGDEAVLEVRVVVRGVREGADRGGRAER